MPISICAYVCPGGKQAVGSKLIEVKRRLGQPNLK